MSNPSSSAQASRTALLAGATGLVGSFCLRLATQAFDRIVAVTRRPLVATSDRVQALVSELDQLGGQPPVPARAALSALGTTMARAGSREAFRHVDHEGVLAFARWARAGGAETFVLVSSAGASPTSRTFYLRTKGETERDLETLAFPRLVILRPGLLIGPRSERRFGEAIAQWLLPRANPVLRGPLRAFRAIPAEQVAAAMWSAAESREPGRFVWHNDQIQAAARRPIPLAPEPVLSQPAV
jgi:uncharacterized protein YbjT (DUF2867 family)